MAYVYEQQQVLISTNQRVLLTVGLRGFFFLCVIFNRILGGRKSTAVFDI